MWSAPIKEKAVNAVDLLFEPDYMEKVCVRMNRRGSFHKKIFTLTRCVIYTFRKLIVLWPIIKSTRIREYGMEYNLEIKL